MQRQFHGLIPYQEPLMNNDDSADNIKWDFLNLILKMLNLIQIIIQKAL
jgi:hypothetical protein